MSQPPQNNPNPYVTPQIWPPTPQTPYGMESAENTSGTDGPIPPEVAQCRFSWGAFGISWIWLIAHRMPLAGIALIVVEIIVAATAKAAGAFYWLLLIILYAVQLWIGFNGHKLAWRKRHFDSLTQYFQIETIWRGWGIGLFAIRIFFIIVAAIVVLFVRARLGGVI